MNDIEPTDHQDTEIPEKPATQDAEKGAAEEGDAEEAVEESAAQDVPETDEETAADETETDDETGGGLDPQHVRLVEAVLFASKEPVTERLLKNRLPEGANLKAVLKHLQDHYAERGVRLVKRGQTWAFRTAPDLTTLLNKEVEVPRKLSRAAIETMAIIAYHQPVTRAEIEEIRGVNISRGTIDILLELGWIGPRGRRQVPGRPMTWGTTDGFLDHFGLESTKDLPGVEELKAAGLLDASPAIQIYRSSIEKEEEQGALSDDGDTGEEEGDEPLNPEG